MMVLNILAEKKANVRIYIESVKTVDVNLELV